MTPEQEDKLLLQLIIQSLEKLDERLAEAGEKNYEAINDLGEKVNAIHVTMARNTESLEAHMARTLIIEEALKPIKSTHDGITVVGKIIGIAALIVTIVGGIWAGIKTILGVH